MRTSLLVALFAGVLSAGAFAGEWISDVSSGCQIWNSRPEPGETVKWTGLCVGGKASGRGTSQWYVNNVPGQLVEAEYREGRAGGKVSVRFPTGRTFDGELVDGQWSGKGVDKWPDGVRYDGSYLKGARNGFGTLSIPRSANPGRYEAQNEGRWVGDIYVVRGLFEGSKFVLKCADAKDCENQTALVAERKARADRDAAEQWQRDAPARQARQLCEAQKATCFASCPAYRYVDPNKYNSLIVNGDHFECKRRCEAISCY